MPILMFNFNLSVKIYRSIVLNNKQLNVANVFIKVKFRKKKNVYKEEKRQYVSKNLLKSIFYLVEVFSDNSEKLSIFVQILLKYCSKESGKLYKF